MKHCNCSTTITRDGSGQLGRFLKALDPHYIPVDERSIEELLVFIKRYAAQIRFYDIPDSDMGQHEDSSKLSWKEFFRRDIAVLAASIATTDAARIKKDYDELRLQVELGPNPRSFSNLFDPILGMAVKIDNWFALASQGNMIHQDLKSVIDSSLREQMKKIIAFEKGFASVDISNPLYLDYSNIRNRAIWGLDEHVDPDTTIYDGADVEKKIVKAAFFVDDLFHSFYGAFFRMINDSDKYLKFALEEYPGHQPHMALFIAFLKLFGLAQNQMNGLTERMLNFYYRDVLQLTAKPSIPDRVFTVYELAKDVAQFHLAKGTELQGKDANGKEQVYKISADLVVNQAKVKELKTIFIEKSIDDITKTNLIESVFARPIANSRDGFGEKFTEPSGKWPTFGKGGRQLQPFKNPCEAISLVKDEFNRKDQARVGFAIASPQILMQGGKRILRLRLEGLKAFLVSSDQKLIKAPFEFLFTAEKGWLKINKLMREDEYKELTRYLDDGIINPHMSEPESAYFIDREKLIVFIYISQSEQAIISFDSELHKGYDFRTTNPVMRLMLSEQVKLLEIHFHALQLDRIHLEVRVGSINPTPLRQEEMIGSGLVVNKSIFGPHFDGLKKLLLENDDGEVDPDKPFDPFTPYPSHGKTFYIGSSEIFNKQLYELAINIKRTQPLIRTILNIAADFHLPDVAVAVRHRKDWMPLATAGGGSEFELRDLASNILFVNSNPAEAGKQLRLDRKPLREVEIPASRSEKGFLQLTNLWTVHGHEGSSFHQNSQEQAPFLQIREISASYYSRLSRLENGIDQFYHVYPFGVTEIYLHEEEGRSKGLATKEPKPKSDFDKLDLLKDYLLVDANNRLLPQFTWSSPYSTLEKKKSPSVKALAAGKKTAVNAQSAFNYDNIVALGAGLHDEQFRLNQYSSQIQESGTLYIGIENAKPLETLSLLFQFAEGSAQDEDNRPPEIHWSYLSYNEWKPLRGENLIEDGTFGFLTTGIVKLEIPDDASVNNSIITNGLTWFAASVRENPERIPWLIDIVAQAAEAVYEELIPDPAHFDNPLAAESITALAEAPPEIASVKQPFASFDGKAPEAGRNFYTRASERLRHKHRAITAWDYEHLVLNRFPTVYKVKCIPHTDPDCLCRHTIDHKTKTVKTAVLEKSKGKVYIETALETHDKPLTRNSWDKQDCCGPQIAPGHVLLVPIANLKNRNAINPLQPKTSRRTLIEIEQYLKKLTSPFVRVHAKNPIYEEVMVAFRVKFIPGTDKGYFLKKLNAEIVQFLTPWAFDEDAEVIFGARIYASSIINFIEERPYVEFITDFFMAVCKDSCCPEIETDEDHEDDNDDEETGGKDEHQDPGEIISKLCNCDDLIALAKEKGKFEGEIVAVPSSPRSILVSVPQHIIIPFEEPEQLSPCERRKQKGIEKGYPEPVAPVDEKAIKPKQPRSRRTGPGGKYD